MNHQTELAIVVTLVIVLITMTFSSESVEATDEKVFVTAILE